MSFFNRFGMGSNIFSNKTVLDKLSENNGVLQYNGQVIEGGGVGTNSVSFESWLGGETVTIDTSPETDNTVPTLTITSGGTFTGTKTVTMSVNETATIYYTLDGSTPTTSSTTYSVALSINNTTTLKAFARDTAGNQSAIQTITYTLDNTAPTLTITAGGSFTGNKTITMSANETSTIYYTLDNTTPTTSSSVYTTELTISNTTTLKAFAKDVAGNESTVQTITYTLEVVDVTAPVLTITAGGAFSGTKTVVMSTNETATIYYTLDGSVPTTASTVYVSDLSISSTTTLKAFAKDTSGNESVVQTVVYTLDETPPENVTNLVTSNVAQTSLTLSWTASVSGDVASYDVYNGVTLLGNTASNTYNVTGLTENTQYTFTVKAKDSGGNVASGTSVVETTSTGLNILVSDNFNRADNTTTLGTSTSGHSWYTYGTWGIIGNEAYQVSNTGARLATLDAGSANVSVEAKFSAINNYARLLVRASNDAINLIAASISSGKYILNKKVGGSWTTLYTSTVTAVAGDIVKVKAYGDQLTLIVNGSILTTVTESFNQTVTKHGIGSDVSTTRFDDFKVYVE